MAADARGYYAALGLNPGASLNVVRAVYRQLAKECHPDSSGCRDGGERFRQITEAYDALSDEAFKAAYDQGSEAQSNKPHDEAPQIEPVFCQICEKVTAQPRRLAFWRVTSFIFASQKNPVQQIYCSDCASKEQWKSTIWTSLLGWWGIPWGPAWAIMHGVTNATGGTREPEIDEALMWQNALAFAVRGDGRLAVGLSNILRKSNNAEFGQRSAEIIRFYADRGVDPNTSLRDVWERPLARTAALFLTAFAVPLGVIAVLFLPVSGDSGTAFADFSGSGLESPSSNALAPDAIDANDVVPISEPEPAPAPEPSCETPPSSGEIIEDHRGETNSGHHLEIDNGSSGEAIIKVRNAFDDQTIASFFVARGGKATLTNIPDGTYRIQYAIGEALAEDCRSFLASAGISANEFPGSQTFETRYEESLDGVRISRSKLSYTLYSVPGGNVRPSSINLDEFNKP